MRLLFNRIAINISSMICSNAEFLCDWSASRRPIWTTKFSGFRRTHWPMWIVMRSHWQCFARWLSGNKALVIGLDEQNAPGVVYVRCVAYCSSTYLHRSRHRWSSSV